MRKKHKLYKLINKKIELEKKAKEKIKKEENF
jgi:hypothetical protein